MWILLTADALADIPVGPDLATVALPTALAAAALGGVILAVAFRSRHRCPACKGASRRLRPIGPTPAPPVWVCGRCREAELPDLGGVACPACRQGTLGPTSLSDGLLRQACERCGAAQEWRYRRP